MFKELVDSLREWFDSACQSHCNGHNNLYTPKLTCLDSDTGIFESIIRHEGENSAQRLIDLAIANIQTRMPPVVYLSHGWIVSLNLTTPEEKQSSYSKKSQLIITGASLGAIIAVMIVFLITMVLVFGIYKRFASQIHF